MKKHNCIEQFVEFRLDKSDIKYISIGYCSVCQNRMMKIFRYQGTYQRGGSMKKLDPKKEKS